MSVSSEGEVITDQESRVYRNVQSESGPSVGGAVYTRTRMEGQVLHSLIFPASHGLKDQS